MIIISQDKKAIHNFDNVLSLQIVSTLKEYSIEVCDAINDGSSLGIYSSEERAKEVLQELIEAVSIKEIEGTYKELEIIIKLKSFVAYEMPEK